jgi:hypothetical protein
LNVAERPAAALATAGKRGRRALQFFSKFMTGKANLNFLDNESALQALERIAQNAAAEGVEWALIGGLAMVFYGSDRLTKDVDVIALKRLSASKWQVVGPLQQGGERYQVSTTRQTVTVDWIVRRDEARRYFQTALAEATVIDGVPIVTPEWLVIMKHIAGRSKDQDDALFLLREKDLVNRKRIKENIVKVAGREAWVGFRANLERWYDLADGKTRKPSKLIDS